MLREQFYQAKQLVNGIKDGVFSVLNGGKIIKSREDLISFPVFVLNIKAYVFLKYLWRTPRLYQVYFLQPERNLHTEPLLDT